MNELKLETRQRGLTVAELVTYILIVLALGGSILGYFHNKNVSAAVAEALAAGEAKKALIEEYFESHGQMPQSEAEAGLDEFTPSGALQDLIWQPGAKGEGSSDKLLNGTLNGIVELGEFGERFEKHESGFLLIARGQDDGTIIWDCMADAGTKDALPRRYLPETCERASDSDE